MNIITKTALTLLAVFTFASCEREFDEPPVQSIPEGNSITIAEIRDMYNGSDVTFEEDLTLFATVTADEASGNLFKEVYLDDGTGAILLRLDAGGGLDLGDRLRINLTNLTLIEFAGTMQIGEANVDNDVTIVDVGLSVSPLTVTLPEMLGNPEAYEAKLLRIENVEFEGSALGGTYAIGGSNPESVNTTVIDCDGVETIIRTSGFSSFADTEVAAGNGTLTAVLSEFNGEYQLKVRDLNDIQFDGLRCNEDTTTVPGVYVSQNFSSGNIFSGGWTTQVVEGIWSWETSSLGNPENAPYASIDNYDGGNTASEAWLISPAMDLSGATAPKLTFISAVGFFGDDLEVYVSTNYNGTSLPGDATWTPLDPILASTDPDFFAWTESGDVDLSAYLSSSVYIGFRYTGSDSDGATWEVDDIMVAE